MLALGIDTSTAGGSVGLADGDRLAAELTLRSGVTHSERLLGSIEALLTAAGTVWDAVELIAVASGPGSFTGLRIGMATAKGLALALGRPVAGFSTLETIAIACAPEPVARQGRDLLVLIDAGRGEVYRGLYRDSGGGMEPVRPEAALPPAAAADGAGSGCLVLGNGFEAHSAVIRPRLPEDAVIMSGMPPIGATLARRAAALMARDGAAALPPPAPNYLRLSDAEVKFRG